MSTNLPNQNSKQTSPKLTPRKMSWPLFMVNVFLIAFLLFVLALPLYQGHSFSDVATHNMAYPACLMLFVLQILAFVFNSGWWVPFIWLGTIGGASVAFFAGRNGTMEIEQMESITYSGLYSGVVAGLLIDVFFLAVTKPDNA